MTLNQDQLDTFARDGYLPFGKILQDDELELLRSEYDREFALAAESGSSRNLSAPSGADAQQQRTATQQVFQIMQMCERNMHFRRLIHDERIVNVIADLIGPNVMLFHDQGLFKPAHHGGPVTWHQDNAYWHARPANLVSCWLTLDDVDVDNGAMQLIPGSHLQPVWHERDAEGKRILFNVEDQVDKAQAKVIALPAGGCMFHHCQTLHYTAPNTTPRQRRAFAIHYMTLGTSRDGDVMHSSFSRPVVRLGV